MTAIPSQLSYGATPADGTAMVAAEVRNPLASILTTVNSFMTIFGGGSIGQTMRANSSSDIGWSNSGLTYRKTTAKTVNNTVTETDLLNGEITVGAGVLGTTGMLRLTTFVDGLNSSGSPATWLFKVKLGGTTVLNTGALTVNNIGLRFGWKLNFELLNTGAAATNVCRVQLTIPQLGTIAQVTTPAGSGVVGTGEKWTLLDDSFATTIDTSTSKLVEVTVTHGTAAATIETKLYGAVAEVI